MHLPRHTIESHASAPLFTHASFSSPSTSAGQHPGLSKPSVVACATSKGFLVAQTDPLRLVASKSWPAAQGGLSRVVPVQHTSLLILVGGGQVPKFAPNKVVLWDEAATSSALPVASKGKAKQHRSDFDAVSKSSHSTLFSAGSEFEAYGRRHASSSLDKSPESDHQEKSRNIASRSPSPRDSLEFSRSSLIDHGPHLSAEQRGTTSSKDLLNLGKSIDTSSVGMASSTSKTRDEQMDDRRYLSGIDSPKVDLAASSFSISASSANLDDPFGSEEVVSPPASGKQSRLNDDLHRLSHSAFVRSKIDPPHQAQMPSNIPSVERSVSSLASTDTQATTCLPLKPSKGREVAELEFSEIVRGVHVAPLYDAPRPEAATTSIIMVVVLSTKAVIFELTRPKLDHITNVRTESWGVIKRASVQTYKNLKGLGAIVPFWDPLKGTKPSSAAVIAVPGKQKGHVQVLRVRPLGRKLLSSTIGAATIIVAHKSSLAFIALSPDGKLLATASSKGTLLRVWSNNFSGTVSPSTHTFSTHGTKVSQPGRTGIGATLVRELRRGSDPASILSVAFTPNGSAVAVASDKGTIHIFELSDLFQSSLPLPKKGRSEQNTSSESSASRAASASSRYLPTGLSNLAGQIPQSMLPQYFSSEWSTAQFRIALKTFGSSSRRHGITGDASSRTTSEGTEKSTEGAWAQMRGRVGDIRKGEAGIDETIFLCWIDEATPPTPASAPSDHVRRSSSRSNSALDPIPSKTTQLRLLALTTSGGWYKIALDSPEASNSSTVLDMYRNDTGDSINRRQPRSDKVAFGCRLVEYRPILATLDGWHI